MEENDNPKLLWKRTIGSDSDLQRIHFSASQSYTFPDSDIRNSIVTGELISSQKFRSNFVKCKIVDLHAKDTNFDGVDVKDNLIKNSDFKNVIISNSSWMDNHLSNVLFEGCKFESSSITGNVFQDITFKNCDLSMVVIKLCKFYNCGFIDCVTTNQIAEMSLFLGCRFEKTEIQIGTIVENFGLNIAHFQDSKIRNGRTREIHSKVDIENLEEVISIEDFDWISRFKLSYFTSKSERLAGGELLDKMTEVTNWLNICGVESNLPQYLGQYYEFLLFLYDNENAPLYSLLKLHELTGEIVDNAEKYFQVYVGVMGIHMSLSRIVEDFLMTTSLLPQRLEKSIMLRVIGPLEESYYSEIFHNWMKSTDVRIGELKKANSPNFLTFVWENYESIMPLIALLLSTRLKLDFGRIRQFAFSENVHAETNESSPPEQMALIVPESAAPFGLSLGRNPAEKLLWEMRIRAIFPKKILFELRLGISTAIFSKIRDVVIEILAPHQT